VEKLLQNKTVLLLDHLANGACSEALLVLSDHVNQSLHLLLVFLANFLIAFDLKLQTLGVVDPIDPLPPRLLVVPFFKYLLELLLGGDHVLLLRVNHQVIVLSEEGNEDHLLLLHAPGQLLQKTKELVLVNSVPLCQTAHVYYRVQGNIIRLQLLQDLLPNQRTIADLIESRDIQDSKAHLLARHFEGSAIIVVDFSGHFLETVGHFDGRIAGEELRGGGLA